jgi:polysaccharide export outer membrane protein
MKRILSRHFLFLTILGLFLGSCTINKDILFKTPTDYVYDELPDSIEVESRITPNNLITMNFFTGDGHMLIEAALGTSNLGGAGGRQNMQMQGQGRNQLSYLIDKDGTAKMPVLGRVQLAGLTIREAEKLLEELYSQYYNEPFVMIQVNNNRVIVSPGNGGQAQVITLINANTTLLEALSLAGGVSDRGIAKRIKLIRYDEEAGERKVYLIDLSTIEGLQEADLIVQPNDIIYVEPLPLIAAEVVREIAPIVTLITTTALLIALINN